MKELVGVRSFFLAQDSLSQLKRSLSYFDRLAITNMEQRYCMMATELKKNAHSFDRLMQGYRELAPLSGTGYIVDAPMYNEYEKFEFPDLANPKEGDPPITLSFENGYHPMKPAGMVLVTDMAPSSQAESVETFQVGVVTRIL